MINITPQKLKVILPQNKNVVDICDSMLKILPKYNIDTLERVSMFIGQCAHESNQFTVVTENLNYSEAGLLRTFRKYFNPATAKQYARQPEKIANRVYANRMGNGSESSGDGWKFRGQGFIQLTGRNNHTNFARFLNMSIDEELSYIRTLDGAMEASCFFWQQTNLNPPSDRMDIRTVTKLINGGFNGLNDRITYVRKAMTVFGDESTDEVIHRSVLKIGDKGPDVIELQERLNKLGYGVSIDGVFGRGTENAIKQLQKDNNLTIDGVVGPKTRAFL